MLGAVRQELLSGIRELQQYNRLLQRLRAFPDLEVTGADYETAAAFFNTCIRNGVAPTGTDMLICSVASRLGAPIFTFDQDFERYQAHLPITLHSI